MAGSVPDIPGVRAPARYAEGLRQDVARLLRRHNTSFPGAQPVSFLKRHIAENLEREDYFVCEKSDGIRCLMYLTREGDAEATYLIDRKNNYYYVQGLHFPLQDDFQKFHVDCIVDGELVLDHEDDGREVLRYLVFDSLVIDGKLMTERTLDKRLGYFRELVYKPYDNLCKQFPDEVQFFPFLIDFKDMEFSYALPKLWNDVIPRLKHGTDGLIFTSRLTPYVFGTDEKILKWKPAEENSIDFRLTLHFPTYTDPDDPSISYPDYDSQPTTMLSVYVESNVYKPYGELYLTPSEWQTLKSLNEPLDERIVECVHDKTLNSWRYLRFRDDKLTPNHISIVEKIEMSVRDGVTKEELLNANTRIREAWKKRIAHEKERGRGPPPPPSSSSSHQRDRKSLDDDVRRTRDRERESREAGAADEGHDLGRTGEKRKAND
ncbi:mRNA capping enzyme, catalytic domain-containing protein [Myxozyma melibiosi]|uniref:mRNA-capping enzyme subunit alpha n=1 Tax=Myxozyma melibiosi TaxID=54550 RepID=A0ABR1F373_9ASCO